MSFVKKVQRKTSSSSILFILTALAEIFEFFLVYFTTSY